MDGKQWIILFCTFLTSRRAILSLCLSQSNTFQYLSFSKMNHKNILIKVNQKCFVSVMYPLNTDRISNHVCRSSHLVGKGTLKCERPLMPVQMLVSLMIFFCIDMLNIRKSYYKWAPISIKVLSVWGERTRLCFFLVFFKWTMMRDFLKFSRKCNY